MDADLVTGALRTRKISHPFSDYKSNDYHEALKSGIRRVVALNNSSTIKGNIDDILKRMFQPS